MKISIGLTALVLVTLSPVTQAQMPDDNVSSDGSYNTAMGTSALFSNDISSNQSPGGFNLAAGYQALYSNSTGGSNVATGYRALYENTSGNYNVALGSNALSLNVTGGYNTAAGNGALLSSNGSNNTAVGAASLGGNAEGDVSTGSNNTAVGFMTMNHFTFGSNNTALGFESLLFVTTGNDNTAGGHEALFSNTSGSANSASGYDSLYSNTTGNYNTASGYQALYANKTGAQNSAFGTNAMFKNHAGSYNTASGTNALYSNTTGSQNIAEGYKAGYSLTTGSNNIDIGNQGVAGESDTIRIGSFSTQTAVYLAGAATGLAAGGDFAQLSVDTSTGQIGIAPLSSERFKTGITPMGSATAKLDELRPVTFQYKSNPQGARQYGLIAEEVAKVYPELVVRDAKGKILTVRYDELAPMLLNAFQKQQQELESERRQRVAQAAEMRELRAQVLALETAQRNK